MTGIDDLRASLARHADEAGSAAPGPAERRRGVHDRIRVVRRRRAATGAAALAVVVAAGVTAVLLPRQDSAAPAPAGATVFGVDVPATMTSLGYEYRLVDVASGDGVARLDLTETSGPRLVSWASSDADRVELPSGDGSWPLVADGSDFTDWTSVDPAQEDQLVAEVPEGRVALAVYELGDQRPAGVTAGGRTFRDRALGGRLLGAVIGDPGQDTLGLALRSVPGVREVTVVSFCADGPADAEVAVDSLTSGGFVSSGCSDGTAVDVAASGSISYAVAPGEDLGQRLRVRTADGGSVLDDDLRAGLAVYDVTDVADAGPSGLPATTEHDGHVWRLVSSATPEVGDREAVTAVPPGPGRRLALVVNARTGRAVVSPTVDGRTGTTSSAAPSTARVDLPVGASTVGYRAVGGARLPDGARAAVGFYERAD
ncbi:hypothetical protein [Nocardioides litoris]|uniref:hypothetical protein n=1 Tax=Nocardioides litoris TaxID=1926648 RepID=UPI001122B7F8|nr:hypothetical protein [Nocardioides litoris]